jgi:hypothetical protein
MYQKNQIELKIASFVGQLFLFLYLAPVLKAITRPYLD